MGPESGDIWTVRVYRDSRTDQLRVFQLVEFKNMSVGVIDRESEDGKIIWFAKSDIQFFDLIGGPRVNKVAANEEGSEKVSGSREPNPTARGSGQPGNDAGVRRERNR